MNNKTFIFIILIGIFLRILTLNIPLYDDGGAIPVIGKFHDNALANIVLSPHGLTNMIFFVLGMKIFGINTIGIRLTLFIFSILYIILIYKFAKILFDEKTAKYSIILSLFSFFAYFNYFILEIDGIITSFFSLAIFYFLYIYLKKESKYSLFLSFLSYSILTCMKYRNGLLIIPIFLFLAYHIKIRKAIFYSLIYLLIGTSFLMSSLLLFFPLYGKNAPQLLSIIFSHNTIQFELLFKLTHPHIFIPSIITLSPLFLLIPILSFKNWEKKYYLLYFWMLHSFIYIILIPSGLSIVKYIAGTLLPPLTILTSHILSKFNIYKKLSFFFPISFLTIILIYLNNKIPEDYWFFITEMGPVIKIWQPLIYFTFLSNFFLFLILIISKKKNVQKITLNFFLIIVLSFNLLLITDNIFDQTHNKLIQEIQTYAKNKNLGIIYSWNEDVPVYLENPGFYIVSEKEQDFNLEYDNNEFLRNYSRSVGMNQQGYIDLALPLETIKKYIITKGGTVILLNYPYKYVIKMASQELKNKIQFIDNMCIKELEKIYKTATLDIYNCN